MPVPQSQFPAPVRTDFLSASDAARLVAGVGVLEVLRLMTEAVEADYGRWQDFDKSARTAAHSASGVIELMPVADAHDYAFKYVNGHPLNPRQGLPTVMAFGALADVATGMPRFVSELTLTTALRTAATSAMAARRLARPGSRSMALIGNGSQSEFQALAFMALTGVRELRLFDLDPAASHKLMRNLRPFLQQFGATASIAASVREAVQGADIVTTATADKTRATILPDGLAEPGMHINAVGGDCPGKTELDAALLRRAQVFVEYEPQTRSEGELQQMPADFAVTELWRVVQGLVPGRTSPQQITLFDSVGFALEDYSALRTMHALARRTGLLSQIELVPALADPRDLFALVQQAQRGLTSTAATTTGRIHATLIGLPTDVGASRLGAAMGPDALRVAQLAPALERLGVSVHDLGNLAGPPNPCSQRDARGLRHPAECLAWSRIAHDAVWQVLQQERLPIMLGGDHSLAIGSISAVARHCRATGKRLRVLWLDAHSDCNTPASSPSGNLHGMPVSSLCGLGPQALAALSGNVPALPASAFCQIGLRSVDTSEKRMIRELGLEVYDMRAIDELGMREAMRRALAGLAEDEHLHLSFDVDFLDPDIAPGTGTPVRGGPSYREAQLCMEMIADTGRLASLDIVELNPALDLRNQTADLVVDLVQSLFGQSILMRDTP